MTIQLGGSNVGGPKLGPSRRGLSSTAQVANRILARLDDLTSHMCQLYREQVPEYAALGDEEMATEVYPVSRDLVESFFRRLRDGAEPAVDDIPELADMGRRRLEMGIPLEPMLHVYRIAGRATWDAVASATIPGEEHVLADLAARWMDYVDHASSAAAVGYLRASHERLRLADAHRRAVLEALLSAHDASEVAAVGTEFSIGIASHYVPVLLSGESVPAREDAVQGATPPSTIAGFRGNNLVLLVPDRLPDISPIEALVSPCLVTWGNRAAPGPGLLTEVVHAEARLAAAIRRGRTTGLFGPDDLLLEQLLVANERVSALLEAQVVRVLEDQDRHGLLTATLVAYLLSGSVPATARRVHVHSNTVAYRLKRIGELTGLDPRVPVEAAHLVLALAAAGRLT
ncbi:MAG TPA: helix-turn-helix domain-containing protein [Acidimicrobiales bacterium]|nr:helix-turn-helix domain-containing protein [Acidimicrobiales bacterium]